MRWREIAGGQGVRGRGEGGGKAVGGFTFAAMFARLTLLAEVGNLGRIPSSSAAPPIPIADTLAMMTSGAS